MNRILFLLALLVSASATAAPVVSVVRVPNDGIQPRVAMDDAGVIHLVYFKGDPAHGDLFYVRSPDQGTTFSPPIRVNSQDGSAIATGTIRGAQIAMGRDGRLHVAWNGSGIAEPKGPGKQAPMLYARMNISKDGFDAERNVIATHYGLDGGGSIAADTKGNVYIAWHALSKPKADEGDRRVWVTKSSDDGSTFSPEIAAYPAPTGACGCCGLKIFAGADSSLYALYRSATDMVHRDIYLLCSNDAARSFTGKRIAPLEIGQCIMSSADFTQSGDTVLAAWETQGKVSWAKVSANSTDIAGPVCTPPGKNQKYPSLAVGSIGSVLMAWSEETSWGRGGLIAWQRYDAQGKPVGPAERKNGLAAWSFPAAFNSGRDFLIFY